MGGMGAQVGGGLDCICGWPNGAPPCGERCLRVEGKGVRGEWRRLAATGTMGWFGRTGGGLREAGVKRGKAGL